jgi:hypothetical protein
MATTRHTIKLPLRSSSDHAMIYVEKDTAMVSTDVK